MSYLFVYFLLTLPVALVAGLVARLRPSVGARMTMAVAVLTGGAALCASTVGQALDKPVLWVVVALLVLLVVVGGPVMIKDAVHPPRR